MSADPLSILLPNPLPPSASPATIASKYPFTSLRKSLRLLIDDNPEALDELENDVSYVYSGYAPISARLVQCVAQKGGVLSNPADKERNATDGGDDSVADGKGKGKKGHGTGRVQAHPILGWKGFEDVMAILPGQTFDLIQKSSKATDSAATTLSSLRKFPLNFPEFSPSQLAKSIVSETPREDDYDSRILPRWMHVYRDSSSTVDGSAEQRYASPPPPTILPIKLIFLTSRTEIPHRNHGDRQRSQYHRGNGRDWQGDGRIEGSRHLDSCRFISFNHCHMNFCPGFGWIQRSVRRRDDASSLIGLVCAMLVEGFWVP